jgi:type VI secretion system secreted protein VgrG
MLGGFMAFRASVITELLGRQHNRILRLTFPQGDGPDALMLPERLDANERVSRDFSYQLTVLSDDAAIAAKQLIGRMVTIELVRADGSLRYFNGYVFEFGRVGTDGGMASYRMVLRPWMAFLQLRLNSGPLPNKTVADLTATIFQRYSFRDYTLKTDAASDEALTEVMQWQESDANFLHRWWEERGWHYHYEHRADGHTLVLGGDSTITEPLDVDSRVRYFSEGGPEDDDAIAQWSSQRRLAATSCAVTSFDFKQPKRVQSSSTDTLNEQGKVPTLEVYEHTGAYGFRTSRHGQEIARLRMEEIEAEAKHFEASGDCSRLQPGRHFELNGHFEHDHEAPEDRQFFVVETQHQVVNNYIDQSGSPRYENRAVAIRRKVHWRPGRGHSSEMPRVYGLHTATVVGRSGEEIDCDEYGRVLVQFHWDRVNEYNEKSYCRVRVATVMAGDRFGFVAIPRIGQEVIIQFLDGHPDRPMITGLVPNQLNMPPWDLPANKTQTGFLTRSTQGGSYENANAFRFEDRKGAEEVWLHAEKNQRIEVENDESHWVGHDRSKTVDRDETVRVKRHRTETVDQNETENIGGNRVVTVGGNKSETVTLAKAESIGLAKALSIGAGYQVSVGAAMNTTVGLSQSEQVGRNKSTRVGKRYTIDVGDELEVKVGQSALVMRSDGTVIINGVEFSFTASGLVQIMGKDVDIN